MIGLLVLIKIVFSKEDKLIQEYDKFQYLAFSCRIFQVGISKQKGQLAANYDTNFMLPTLSLNNDFRTQSRYSY